MPSCLKSGIGSNRIALYPRNTVAGEIFNAVAILNKTNLIQAICIDEIIEEFIAKNEGQKQPLLHNP